MMPRPVCHSCSQSVLANLLEPVSLSPKKSLSKLGWLPRLFFILEKLSRCDLGLANLYDVAAEFLSLLRCWNCYYTSVLGVFEVLVIRTSHYIIAGRISK